ncbi:lipid-A-disaccharide kinase [Rhodopseudomonas faecalis]|uniref:Tetraacyldisaccharide 4'-kinase n=1 Tax=Rhodopseudomonas faecalis TaxID=99655 RepID=A0A318TN48_9BRAD|nr:tetraacyldisaccharide 4'-kinase [Rhodopseudomonas faecalis]PYF04448.1 lipid-A-disaccharide kinase [Rhodopseudomonas faecalis]
MREPAFWQRRSLPSAALLPLAALYGAIAAWRMKKPGLTPSVPVLCVGNYHGGGAGKTPTTLAVVRLLRELDETPVVLSRGYGGRLQGPVLVDPATHQAGDVGDEPLMMAREVPVVVAKDRQAGAALALSRRASVIVMDDGFQNPALAKDAALIVIDSQRAIGNGRVMPAGPLRAPLPLQLERTSALVIVGDGRAAEPLAAAVREQGGRVLRAAFQPDAAVLERLRGRRLLAFAGIGDPDRFFATLRGHGLEVAATVPFPDHHPFSAAEIAELAERARRDGLVPVTTDKDLARLGAVPELEAAGLTSFPVTLGFDDEAALRRFLAVQLAAARDRRRTGARR